MTSKFMYKDNGSYHIVDCLSKYQFFFTNHYEKRAGHLVCFSKDQDDCKYRVHERGKTDALFSNLTLAVFFVGGIEWCRVVFALAYPRGLM